MSELKKWVETWIEFSKEMLGKSKSGRQKSCDSSSDFESTDNESRNSSSLPANTIIVSGPSGSGKTSAIYAVCNECKVNVLEINASSKRTGKASFSSFFVSNFENVFVLIFKRFLWINFFCF